MYQGHLPDGSSVQQHSAGGLYPFVLYARQVGDRVLWGVIQPNGTEIEAERTYPMAAALAEAMKAEYDAARQAPVHRIGDPVEPEPTAAQLKNDGWTARRDADFNLGPGLPPV